MPKSITGAPAEPTLLIPKGKQARRFVQAIGGLFTAAGQPGSETGEHADATINYWIVQLSDLTEEQADDLDPVEQHAYLRAMRGVLEQVLDRPSKKR